MDHYCIITFSSTHEAIAAEQHLQTLGLNVRLIPVPPQITAGCGLSLRFNKTDFKKIYETMTGLPNNCFYEIYRDGPKKHITPLF